MPENVTPENTPATEGAAPEVAPELADAGVAPAEPTAASIVAAGESVPAEAATAAAEAAPAAAIAPGWYPNPDNAATELYWDGSQWQAGSERPREYSAAQGLAAAPRKSGGFGLIIGGSLVAIVAAVVGIASDHSGNGGFLWYGGLILGVVLLARGWSRRTGMSKANMIIGAVLSAVAVLVMAGFALDYLNQTSAQNKLQKVVGSCWTAPDNSGNVKVVDCSSKDAKQKAIASVSNEKDCPSSTIGTIYVDSSKKYLCMDLK